MRLVTLAVLFAALSSTAAELTRGPYLQLAGPTEMTVVFRTDAVSSGEVRFVEHGQTVSRTVSELVPGVEHVLQLTGLTPLTTYDYEVWVDGVLLAGGASHQFTTYPQPGQPTPFRFFAWGDSGTGDQNQLSVAERMVREQPGVTFSLILGDIIYPYGEAPLYDARYFEPYAPLLRRMVIWPTIGNHDVMTDPLGGPYLDAFHLPKNNPAATELYYSWDYGDAHFVCLDTHVNSFVAGSPQLTWLAADLAASTAKWKFAYFHVPPYSGGNHADDQVVKDNILPVLEAAGVDVVFTGHSHVYERTYLLKSNAIQQSDRSTYVKNVPGAGTLYVVSGTSGQSVSLVNPAHPMMAFQAGNTLGVSVVDVIGNDVHGYFLQNSGAAIDLFHLSKGVDTQPPRVLSVRSLSPTAVDVVFDEPVFAGSGPGGAENLRAWDVTPRVLVQSAVLDDDARTVHLTTSMQPPGDYTVRAVGIGDRSGQGNLSLSEGTWSMRRRVTLTDGSIATWTLGPVSTDWRAPGASPAGFNPGRLPLGYGALVDTTVPVGTVTAYVRLPLRLDYPVSWLRELTLTLDYDDGFVASLNGRELARQNVPEGQTELSTATAQRNLGLVQVIALPPPASTLLGDGGDVLAFEVHNVGSSSSDLFLSARLEAELELPPGYDAGMPDAGLVIDAGLEDAGVEDSGVPDVDAGTPDAGVPEVDSGIPDAGAADAGQGEVMVDAGSEAPPVDAGTPSLHAGGGGCSCATVDPLFLLALVVTLRRRRR